MDVLYPGTFDPITLGHVDLIDRAARLFDNVVVAVVQKSSKQTMFSFQKRLDLVERSLKEYKNVKVEGFNGLIVEYARKKKIRVLLRGLRMISDFESEFQMALTNRKIEKDVETIFLMPHPDYSYVSSRLIKEASSLGADLSSFVPPVVNEALENKKNES